MEHYLTSLLAATKQYWDKKSLNTFHGESFTYGEMATRAAKLPPEFFYRAMAIVNSTDLNFRTASNKQFLVELALIRLCQLLSPSTTAMTSGGR